ncbi:histidine kinase [Lipingzhangella sp. LS1_29]|uniref:Histidine kinase n=1 Tax=Lipingzhangella rawalii TaxID=2055835 RepID=A0ABU2H089_9ACTN|nr:histidine kinase [Lipingzhangella rawalii]MDS1268720.1 histidine kinase [Lipingzhangella rawalii]
MATRVEYLALVTSLIALVSTTELVRRGYRTRRRERALTAEATRSTLRTAAQAVPSLRSGLRPEPARKAARHLRTLLGTPAVALVTHEECLAWVGVGSSHSEQAHLLAAPALRDGRTCVVDRLDCGDPSCPIESAVVAPLTAERRTVGALIAVGPSPETTLVGATDEVARWVSAQLELAELERSRARLAEAELRALRLQISPHFVYNCLTTIASFVRTNPERARGLLLDFADFARYAFRSSRNHTTLDEELHSIDRYLALERARFGERLQFSVRVAPEVLAVQVPFLCLQPLVENAIRHGMEGKRGNGQVTVTARDAGAEAQLSVEDDGVGMAPEFVESVLSGEVPPSGGIGLANVDERLRAMYGDAYGLVVDTGPEAGTKISLRIPKFRPQTVD